jgi:hypothetical protein
MVRVRPIGTELGRPRPPDGRSQSGVPPMRDPPVPTTGAARPAAPSAHRCCCPSHQRQSTDLLPERDGDQERCSGGADALSAEFEKRSEARTETAEDRVWHLLPVLLYDPRQAVLARGAAPSCNSSKARSLAGQTLSAARSLIRCTAGRWTGALSSRQMRALDPKTESTTSMISLLTTHDVAITDGGQRGRHPVCTITARPSCSPGAHPARGQSLKIPTGVDTAARSL